MKVTMSQDNRKMGAYITSTSFPPPKTCNCEAGCFAIRAGCKKKWECYAMNMYYNPMLTLKGHEISTVGESWERNWEIYQSDKEQYWREVEAAIMMSRFFRYFVGGDIPDTDYFIRMLDVAERNPHCEIICFTKKFDICNKVLETRKLPSNLHLIFSMWKGLEMNNPFNLPECHVLYKDGTTTAKDEKTSFICSGSCEACAKTKSMCFNLKNNEQVLIKQH